MADPQTAVANQLRNIEVKTGKTMAQLCSLICGMFQMPPFVNMGAVLLEA